MRDDTFVQSVYWDSLRQGLLAGDRLAADLERMDIAYLETQTRELELSKDVSLRRLDPLALARLRSEGECYVRLPKALFDLDCPGHYQRRLVHVAVTVACVGGPQSTINLRLTLHGSQLQTQASTSVEAETQACRYPSIVTSTGVQDSGLFGSNDGRYLPFEGVGAVSSWHLAFSNTTLKQFDWDSVTDVVMHLQYTAVDGGDSYRDAVSGGLRADLLTLAGGFTDLGMSATGAKVMAVVSAKRDDATAWDGAVDDGTATAITVEIGDKALPYFAQDTGAATKLHVVLVGATTSGSADLTVPSDGTSVVATGGAWVEGTLIFSQDLSLGSWPDDITIDLSSMGLPIASLDDILIVVETEVS